MDDQEIVELYWSRSEDAVFATSVKYGTYLRVVANHILHNDADAEECVNDTYLKAWASIPPQRPERLLAFLARITRNMSLNRLRKRSAQKRGSGEMELLLSEIEEFSSAVPSPENQVEESALLERINQYLRAQPAQKRTIFLKRYWAMMGVREIAEEAGMTQSKVSSILYRMRQELKRQLKQERIYP